MSSTTTNATPPGASNSRSQVPIAAWEAECKASSRPGRSPDEATAARPAASLIREQLIAAARQIVAEYVAGKRPMTAVNRAAIMCAHAIDYADNGWKVFPLGTRKAPRIKSPHPEGSVERRECKGRCGQDGHGVWDATDDIATICRWWMTYRGANIGGAVPDGLFVIDLDPRKDGHVAAMAKLTTDHGALPRTLTTKSGRGDGGRHLFYRRPQGRLSIAQLGPEFTFTAQPGIDIKDRGGLIVLPPSIHHVTGKSYTAVDAAIAALPASLITSITVPEPAPRPERTVSEGFFDGAECTALERFFDGAGSVSGQSPSQFNDSTSWAKILQPHGWTCWSPNPDADGAVWLHPRATSSCSATITDGRLYVYSTSTVFEPTTPGDPHGYSRFDAYELLNQ